MDAIEKIARALSDELDKAWALPSSWGSASADAKATWHRDARRAIRALNAAGFAIVPQEPTEAMIKASCVFNRHHVTDCFKAMLAAGQVRPDAS